MDNKVKRAILVNISPHGERKEKTEAQFTELARLIETYSGIVIAKIVQKRSRPSAKTFLGKGKTEEVKHLALELKADLVIVNDFLKANQANNLYRIFNCEIWDRFETILKIFGKHAQSRQAKLQIELTTLKYEFPKLFGKGATLSQQAGHIGIRSGAGEKLIELKRRHLKRQIQKIEQKLGKMHRVKHGQRERRLAKNLPLIAIVGYTNSGKSTLLQSLTGKKTYIADKLFATLETKIGHTYLPEIQQKVLISDTIGFIKNLPPMLFECFLTTLEEIQHADIILHIIDITDPEMHEKISVVEETLAQLQCQHKRKIYVFNKIDLLKSKNGFKKLKKQYAPFKPVFISSLEKQSLKGLDINAI